MEFLHNHERRLLQDVLRVSAVRHECVDVTENPPLMLRHQQHQLLLLFELRALTVRRYLDKAATPVADGATVSIIPAVAGGSVHHG